MWYILKSLLALAFWHLYVKSPERTEHNFHSLSEAPWRSCQWELQNRSYGLFQADWTDVKCHSMTFSSVMMPQPAFCADLLPLSFSSGVNNKQLPRQQAHAVNRLWLLMKSTRDDLMLLFLVDKSYYFNFNRICPLWAATPPQNRGNVSIYHCLSVLPLHYRAQDTWNGPARVCLCFSRTMKRDTSIQILPGKRFDANLGSRQSRSGTSAVDARCNPADDHVWTTAQAASSRVHVWRAFHCSCTSTRAMKTKKAQKRKTEGLTHKVLASHRPLGSTGHSLSWTPISTHSYILQTVSVNGLIADLWCVWVAPLRTLIFDTEFNEHVTWLRVYKLMSVTHQFLVGGVGVISREGDVDG